MDILNKFLSEGKTQFHLVNEAKSYLSGYGFELLDMDSAWQLKSGGRYMVAPYSSMLIAFIKGNDSGDIRLAAAHTDFPMLKLKPKPELKRKNYLQANVEPYGGLIASTWFDRPLGLAGKVISKGKDAFNPESVFIDSGKPVFVIPNLAPHLKKDSGAKDIDVQKELIPLTGCSKEDTTDFLMQYISELAGVNKEDILDYDLYLYVWGSPVTVGINDEFLCAPRIDNISSVSAITEALAQCKNQDNTVIGAFFDNEEIGSRSKQGADSLLLKEIVDRITDNKAYFGKAFNISLDVAHATHPNYPEKSDITNDIMLGSGVVLKTSASQRYVTDSEAGAVITALCNENNIKLQKQVNRSGMAGGQTLGPIMSSYLPVKSVDMGLPMLAMHSAGELICRSDYIELKKLLIRYCEYQTSRLI